MQRLLPRLAAVTALLLGPLAAPAAAEASISGEGSSFVLIEVDQWRADVSKFNPPLVVNYVGSSSGNGRQRFLDPPANRTVDFAISDIPYVGASKPPIPFAYVPISAGGMAFMFNLKDKAGRRIKDLRLTPETACKIFTNQITKWSDPLLLADNPKLRAGVSQDKIKLVLRNGAAGTSYILGQYCIATSPAVWDQFQVDAPRFPGFPQGYDGAPGPPVNQWPIPLGAVNAGNSDGNADQVANEATGESSICVVETGFAKNRKFPVASVKNAAGSFVQPSDSAVTKALSYAGSDPTGTQKLDFVTPDANAYNPSTYSYALVPITTGLDPAKGTVLAKFLNYAVGAGQESAEVLGYAPLPQNLVDLAFNLIAQIPGAPAKESYTAVPPKAPPAVEEETPDPGTDPGTNPGDGGGAGGGGGGGGGQTPAAGDGGGAGGGQTPAGSDGGTGSASGNDGGTTGSGGGGSGTSSDGGSTPAAGGAATGSITPGSAGGSTTTVATVKGNTVTNSKTTVVGKPGAPSNTASGNQKAAGAGAFVEQASERPVEQDSSVPLAWVLALGAAGYLFARRGRKSVVT
jgi:phosphate transport system substrate-binding protein